MDKLVHYVDVFHTVRVVTDKQYGMSTTSKRLGFTKQITSLQREGNRNKMLKIFLNVSIFLYRKCQIFLQY